jgi:hypothetical protein
MSREQALSISGDTSAAPSPSARKALEDMRGPAADVAETGEMPETGDDDAEDLETLEAEESALAGDDDFYADALGDA